MLGDKSVSTVPIQQRQLHNNQALRLSRPLELHSSYTGLTNLCDVAPATHTKQVQAHAANNQAVLSPSLLTSGKSDLPEPEPSTIYAFICGHNLLPFFCTCHCLLLAMATGCQPLNRKHQEKQSESKRSSQQHS